MSDDPLAGYPVTIEIPVAWGEMDAYGHVNNAVYFRYFEDVRMAHFDALGVTDLMASTRQGPILAATDARFRAALRHPDTVRIGSRIEAVAEDRFTMRYGVWSQGQSLLAAEGSARVVYFDYAAGGKCAIPDRIRRELPD